MEEQKKIRYFLQRGEIFSQMRTEKRLNELLKENSDLTQISKERYDAYSILKQNHIGSILSKRIKLAFENIIKVQGHNLSIFDINTILGKNGKISKLAVVKLINKANEDLVGYHIIGSTYLNILHTLQDTMDGVAGVSLDVLPTTDPVELRKDIDAMYDAVKQKELKSLEHLGYDKSDMDLVRKYLPKDETILDDEPEDEEGDE